jgi:hypothetical protein
VTVAIGRRRSPGRCAAEPEWTVELTEWHLAGPLLVTFICALSQRMRLSRARISEFLRDWLGLELSTATINQCIHEAGRAVAPVVEAEIQAAVRNVELVYADETSWKEHGQLLWLWVFTCATATLFVVGKRCCFRLWREQCDRCVARGGLAYRAVSGDCGPSQRGDTQSQAPRILLR